jgi:hypothetical protein
MKKARCIELRTAEGKVILVLYLYEKEVALEDDQDAPAEKKPEAKREKPKPNTAQDSRPRTEQPMMTDAQKRYLFRILAERGIEGDKAYARLKELFQVDSLKEITKLEASRAIESLLNDGKGGSDGISF